MVPSCYNCQRTMVLREKEGSKFWGCENWKNCGGKTIPYNDGKASPKPRNEPSTELSEVMETLHRIELKVDALLPKPCDHVWIDDLVTNQCICEKCKAVYKKDITSSSVKTPTTPTVESTGDGEVNIKDIPF